MCGIAGFWKNSEARESEAEATIRAMTAAIAQRGPDAEGAWFDLPQGVALGHRRLSIRDLSATGNQPMISSDGRYALVFNGEIYNVDDLKILLEKQGPLSLRGSSDTEVFLEAIVRLGLREALFQSTGMFAIGLWDRREASLTLARDRFGEKPLYVAEIGADVVFGSELKALKPYPGMPRQPSGEAIALYLRYGYVPPPLTIIEGIGKCAPGQSITFRRKNGQLQKEMWRFWKPETELFGKTRENAWYTSLEDAADRAEDILGRAVRRQLVSDVPLGAFLSGGIDSSLIVALMKKAGGKAPKTFTIGFDDPRFNEAPFARKVADHLGTEHTEAYINNRQLFDIIPKLPFIYDEPVGDSSCIPAVLVSTIARQQVTVALSGDGGDELFAGYNHYRWGSWVDLIARLVPSALRGAAKKGLVGGGLALRQRRLVRLGETLGAQPTVDPLLLLNANIPDLSGLMPGGGSERPLFAEPNMSLPVSERAMLNDIQGHLPGDILAKIDRASMHIGLETRAPFLDPDVAAFAFSLPLNYRMNGKGGKIVLKKLLSRFLPPDLFDRPKAGFGMPLQNWFLNDLRGMTEKYLLHYPVRYETWLNRDGITRLWREHQSGTVDRQRELWTLLTLLLWLEAEGI
ncbi:MAG: asparagine synthase (glutamine-hydrolyzing) [Bdellovibrionales bacterium]